LQFNADWAHVSLPSAYKLWQLGLLRSPPPPANTANPYGAAMSQYDQVRSDTELPQYLLDFHSMDFHFAMLREKFTIKEQKESPEQWRREAVQNFDFSGAMLSEMNKFAPLLAQWEADVQWHRFTASDDVTVDQIKTSLAQYKKAAENFESKAFTTIFG